LASNLGFNRNFDSSPAKFMSLIKHQALGPPFSGGLEWKGNKGTW